jgi:hypothetical protein
MQQTPRLSRPRLTHVVRLRALARVLVCSRAASSVAALLCGALAAERQCPPLKAKPRQAQQGLRHPQCAGIRGREVSYTVQVRVACDSQEVCFRKRGYACVAIKLPQRYSLQNYYRGCTLRLAGRKVIADT